MERPHWKVVGTTIMDRKLLIKVCKGIKAVGRIEAFLVFPVTALYFAIVPWGVRPDELVSDAEFFRCRFK